jgi:fructokinase
MDKMLDNFRIGIDLGGTKIESIVIAPDGAEIHRERMPAPQNVHEHTVRAVRDLVLGAERQVGQNCSVGIGIPGALSRTTGLVKNANSTWLIGKPLQQDLETALERPIRVDNDANCFAVSEAIDGAGVDAAVVFGVILGTGVGAGIAIHGRSLPGANAIAGEWGHNPLPWLGDDERPGDRCYCGRRGCIETFLSGPALERVYRRATGEAMTVSEIVHQATDHDINAARVIARYENQLARGLAHVINLLDPDVIVLGGGLSKIARLYEHVPSIWGQYIFSDIVETRLRPPKHSDSSGVRGAAWLWPPSQDNRAAMEKPT